MPTGWDFFQRKDNVCYNYLECFEMYQLGLSDGTETERCDLTGLRLTRSHKTKMMLGRNMLTLTAFSTCYWASMIHTFYMTPLRCWWPLAFAKSWFVFTLLWNVQPVRNTLWRFVKRHWQVSIYYTNISLNYITRRMVGVAQANNDL